MLNRNLILLTFLPSTIVARRCIDNPCLNGKKCYDIGDDDYECICEEYAGKHCQIAPPGVSCQSSRIQVEIDRSWLIEKVQSDNHNYIYMGNGQSQNRACRATLSEDDPGKIHVTLDKNFRQCGTSVKRNDNNGDYIYSNKVFFNVQNAGVQMAVAALVQWTCEYQDEYTVSSGPISGDYGPADDRVRAKGIVGDFNLATQAYLKPTFKAKDLAPSYVTKGDNEIFHVLAKAKKWLSFQTMLTGEAQARDTHISVQKCFISSARSPVNRPTQIEHVIEDYCPTNDAFTKIYSNGQSNNAQFAVNILAHRREWMEEYPFYFHCEVQLCPAGESCPTGCSRSNNNEQTEEASGEPLIVYSTTGPYFWQETRALIVASQINAKMHDDADSEHSANMADLVSGEIRADNSNTVSESDTTEEKTAEKEPVSLVAGLAIVTLLAVLVMTAVATIWRRSGGTKKQRKIHRNATPINMNFAHEGSLRKTQREGRQDYETVPSLSSRVHKLPGNRPAGARLNYV